MAKIAKELIRIVNMSMPFPANVLKAYARLDSVFTSGDLAREAGIPRSTAKYYVRKMVDLHMISKVPYRKKYQKYANADKFSNWLQDLLRLALKPLEE
ncbi:hypothetical protein CW704_04925 [Candidatus Bathyarchaeota archaeon]|nr:MAG: hypothetical protein CW704_04925 [Candidatus Bathyarchaeota archaeon]RLG99820.1 MAG: hypothetical protein DRO38_07275 [Candidatus Bathyarchaeota archaeon]